MALSPEAERRIIDEYKQQYAGWPLNWLYEQKQKVDDELIVMWRGLAHACAKDPTSQECLPTTMLPGPGYGRGLHIQALKELIQEAGGGPAGLSDTIKKYLPWAISGACLIGVIISSRKK